jgi:hypothetical protein
MPHDHILDRLFVRTPRKGWQALALRDPIAPRFRTKRVAKLAGPLLLFTIGETELGRANGLDRTITSAIRDQGLRPVEQPSTSGSLSQPKTYVGIDLSAASAEQVESILATITAAIGRAA